jgi:hypothetical protein
MKTMNTKHTAKSSALKAPLTFSGSGDSPLFPGLPEQNPNIAEGNATWF